MLRRIFPFSQRLSFPISNARPTISFPRFQSTESSDSSGKLFIGFVCKVCNGVCSHFMSKLAYTKGVVLIECKGCNNRHLIADNLNWFGEGKNIQEILAKKASSAKQLGSNEWIPEEKE